MSILIQDEIGMCVIVSRGGISARDRLRTDEKDQNAWEQTQIDPRIESDK